MPRAATTGSSTASAKAAASASEGSLRARQSSVGATRRTSSGGTRSSRTTATAGPSRRRAATKASSGPAADERLKIFEDSVRNCRACGLHANRAHPSVGDGPIDAPLVLVAAAPGQHEDLHGSALAGSARNVIDHALWAADIAPDEVRVTTLVRCHPPDDRPAAVDEVRACSSHLAEEFSIVRPSVVVALGAMVASFLYGRDLDIGRVAGYRLDMGGITLIPTYAPVDALRGIPQASVALRRDIAAAKAVLDGRLSTGAALLEEVRAHLADGTLKPDGTLHAVPDYQAQT
ncbi:MAG: uracil-DNA glycosylase [Nitriliruptoraceae bacterium]